jgi:hypothetical protein
MEGAIGCSHFEGKELRVCWCVCRSQSCKSPSLYGTRYIIRLDIETEAYQSETHEMHSIASTVIFAKRWATGTKMQYNNLKSPETLR